VCGHLIILHELLLAELRTDGGPTSFALVAPLQRSSRRLRPPALIDCDAMVNLITADWLAGGPFISCKKYAYAVRRITETTRLSRCLEITAVTELARCASSSS